MSVFISVKMMVPGSMDTSASVSCADPPASLIKFSILALSSHYAFLGSN